MKVLGIFKNGLVASGLRWRNIACTEKVQEVTEKHCQFANQIADILKDRQRKALQKAQGKLSESATGYKICKRFYQLVSAKWKGVLLLALEKLKKPRSSVNNTLGLWSFS